MTKNPRQKPSKKKQQQQQQQTKQHMNMCSKCGPINKRETVYIYLLRIIMRQET